MTALFVTSISKEGSVISIALQDKATPIKVDCKTRQVTSYTGRIIKSLPVAIKKEGLSDGEIWALEVLKNWLKTDHNTREFSQLELFIAHLDLIDCETFNLPDECPKGYINWLRDNGKEISKTTLTEFKGVRKIEQLSQEDQEVCKKILEYWPLNRPVVRWYISEKNKELRKKFNKILKASAKIFDWSLCASLEAWYFSFIVEGLGKKTFGNDWVEHLDDNRDFRYNIRAFEYARDAEKNSKILANEAKIKAIEQLSNDQFIVIVPADIEQFILEGKMQNNCVGYHYNDSIASGCDLIYFIRRVATPKQSYLTNRFNVRDGETVESRKKCNSPNNDKDAIELIKKIDERIKELLK